MKKYMDLWDPHRSTHFNLGTRLRWVVGFTPRPLYPQDTSRRYPLDRRLGRLQSLSGRDGEEKKPHHCPWWELNPSRPARSLITILTELPRPHNYDHIGISASLSAGLKLAINLLLVPGLRLCADQHPHSKNVIRPCASLSKVFAREMQVKISSV
jgi:hypothetical protein